MNLLKHKTLLVGGVVALVLSGAALYGLFHFHGVYAKADRELTQANDRLHKLNNRNPFPSDENVKLVEQNRDLIRGFLSSLQADFQRGQVAETNMEPAQFAALIERISRDLTVQASNAVVRLPERFGLGFGRYVAGELPAPGDIPRLVVQARTVAAVCSVLFEARIGELVSVERTLFEGRAGSEATATAAPFNPRAALAGAPDAPSTSLLTLSLPPVESNELFHAERLAVSFLAREHAAWEALNGLARSPLFAVVKHIEVANEGNPKLLGAKAPQPGQPGYVAPVAPAPGVAAPLIIHPPREERILSGRENVRVSVVLDVYRFAGGPVSEVQP